MKDKIVSVPTNPYSLWRSYPRDTELDGGNRGKWELIRFYLLFALIFDLIFCGSALAQGADTLEGVGAYGGNGAFAGGAIQDVMCDIMNLVGGTFGGMLLTAAGVVALAYAAFGDAKYASSLIVVGVGSFAISSMVSVYFGEFSCEGGGGAAATRTIIQTDAPQNNALRVFGIGNTEPAALPHGDDSTDDPFDF